MENRYSNLYVNPKHWNTVCISGAKADDGDQTKKTYSLSSAGCAPSSPPQSLIAFNFTSPVNLPQPQIRVSLRKCTTPQGKNHITLQSLTAHRTRALHRHHFRHTEKKHFSITERSTELKCMLAALLWSLALTISLSSRLSHDLNTSFPEPSFSSFKH